MWRLLLWHICTNTTSKTRARHMCWNFMRDLKQIVKKLTWEVKVKCADLRWLIPLRGKTAANDKYYKNCWKVALCSFIWFILFHSQVSEKTWEPAFIVTEEPFCLLGILLLCFYLSISFECILNASGHFTPLSVCYRGSFTTFLSIYFFTFYIN